MVQMQLMFLLYWELDPFHFWPVGDSYLNFGPSVHRSEVAIMPFNCYFLYWWIGNFLVDVDFLLWFEVLVGLKLEFLLFFLSYFVFWSSLLMSKLSTIILLEKWILYGIILGLGDQGVWSLFVILEWFGLGWAVQSSLFLLEILWFFHVFEWISGAFICSFPVALLLFGFKQYFSCSLWKTNILLLAKAFLNLLFDSGLLSLFRRQR